MNRARSITASKTTALFQLLIAGFLAVATNAEHLTSKDVLVVYNSSDPESRKLAEVYQKARTIPTSQILGLELSKQKDITRKEFETTILQPLRDHFDEQNWWTRARDAQGLLLPTKNRIRAIVLMRGVPLRIQPTPKTPPQEGEKPPTDPVSPRDEASVDSELALFGIETVPSKGVLKNAFFESKVPLSEANAPYLVLITRIDAPAYITCKKMITAAVETEKTGLWGRAYVDIANKFPQGDQWLEKIIATNQVYGIPTITDRFKDTLPKNYPMTDTALYYGWYDWNVSGPFLNPTFQFRPGAIAIHLHSFSAEQLTNAHKNWAAPMLTRGATATVGNVYEPYLALTHHFDILHERLLNGWTFAEASWAAMPVASWQGVVLGDPLYRPFLHIDGTGENRDGDRDFRALRAASRQWPNDATGRRRKLAEAAEKLSSGNLAEGLALDYLESKDIPNAQKWLENARNYFTEDEDKLRQDIQLIAIDRAGGRKQKAIIELRAAKEKYGSLPATQALSGWLDILDPPPPPIANPTKIPKK